MELELQKPLLGSITGLLVLGAIVGYDAVF